MRKILNLVIFVSSFAASTLAFSAACNVALPTNNPNFCASFKSVAQCYCTNSGLDAGYCENIATLGKRMVDYFGSIETACWYQKYTSTQDCIDNWHCYLNGGVDSMGRACSGTGSQCPSV